VAAAQACEAVAGVSPELKWPNDLLVEGRKLAGILAQAGGSGGRVDYVVVGIGLNVGWAPPEGACLGEGFDPGAVLEALLAALQKGEQDQDAEYRRRLATLGRSVRVTTAGGDIVGTALDVLPDGRLVLAPPGRPPVTIDTGDVVHLRPMAD